MNDRIPVTEVVRDTEAQQQIGQLLNRVSQDEIRILIERDGVPVAAIVSARDLERMNSYERDRAERFRVVDQMRAAFDAADPFEVEREVARALEQVRAQNRLKRQRDSA